MKSMNVVVGSFFALVLALPACSGGGGTGTGDGTGTGTATGDGGGGGTGKTGGGTTPSPSPTSSSSSSSTASCCLQLKFYSCPSEGDATKCFDNGSPGACKADSTQDKKCCKETGSFCSRGSDCCSGSCVTDPDDEDSTICK